MHPFMRQINITSRCAALYRERKLADTGLAGCQIPYLMALYRLPGLSQEELARDLNVNKSSVTRQLASLEDKGYVRRVSAPQDKRTLLVYPTDKALALRDRLHVCFREWNDYLMEDFTEEEQAQLSVLMARIAKKAEAYVRGGEDD